MLYAIICNDCENSLDKRLAARPEHIKRLEDLHNEGRLILAGPHPAIDNIEPGPNGFTGSLIVAEFKNLQAAQQWADEDPYLITGAYESVCVKPFKKVFP